MVKLRSLRLCVLASLCFSILHAEVIDRIVAVVEGRIITLSDLRRERETRARLGEKPVADDVTLAKQLADDYLIEQQISGYPNIDVTDQEINEELAKLNSGKPDSVAALRDAIRRRIRIQKFFDVKFRQLIRPTDEAIRKYYEEVFIPEAKKRGLQSIPPLTDSEMASAIRQNVIQETLDHEVEAWLEAMRKKSNVEVFQ
jgi:hypothetical protein